MAEASFNCSRPRPENKALSRSVSGVRGGSTGKSIELRFREGFQTSLFSLVRTWKRTKGEVSENS